MKRKLIGWIKKNTVLYTIYRVFMKAFLQILKLFASVDSHKAFFVSFNGSRYDDSPRAVYEYMLQDSQMKEYRFVWAFRNPEQYKIPKGKKVRFDSFSYIWESITAGIWVTNVSVERGFQYKKKETFYVNTWHGTPLKKLGEESRYLKTEKHRESTKADLYCAQSQYDAEIFCKLFDTELSHMLICDLPRNDVLLGYSERQKNAIRKKLGIPEKKKVLLYMPTFREYWKNADGAYNMYLPFDLKEWQNTLGSEYVILVRFHYLVERDLELENTDGIISVTNYPKLADLYIIADLLIGDYSSAYFDYVVTEKPFLCFAYDRQEYEEKRGLYFPLEGLLCPVTETQEELLKAIKNFDYEAGMERAKQFKRKFAPYAGHATEKVVEQIKYINFKK